MNDWTELQRWLGRTWMKRSKWKTRPSRKLIAPKNRFSPLHIPKCLKHRDQLTRLQKLRILQYLPLQTRKSPLTAYFREFMIQKSSVTKVSKFSKCKVYIFTTFSLKTPRPRGWVRAGRPSGSESSFNKRNMYQYPHVSQLFILTSVAKPGIPGAIKNGWVCTADYRMLLGTAVRPVPARMPYISRLCDVGATDVKRWWWWWWFNIQLCNHLHISLRYVMVCVPSRFWGEMQNILEDFCNRLGLFI